MTSSASASTPAVPVCPNCGSALHLERDGALDAWVCPNGHGLGFTVSEAYERIGEDEIHTIWQQARTASPGTRACPMCATTMVAVAVPPNAHVSTVLNLDVCLVDELFWFDAGELDIIPIESPDPGPSREEEAHLATIAKQFGDQLISEWAARENTTLTDHLIHRLKTPSPPV
jgi:Zn-finger nucleic acid-binding protein